MSLQNYDLAETAQILKCYESYLEENLAFLPHQKIGRAVAFDDDDIAEIKRMCRVRPAARPTATPAAGPAPSIRQIRPKGARRTG
ncbi:MULTISPECIES: hypothetical protein [unclassified Streptomyces]|uniref:hypothetical protein n=1 Tax=unclassified Streptomyces TaxID=2593676 RepID=UPI0004C11DFE|nr:hypothetical protein [Streptomyces sp. NRRL S-241]